MHLRAISKGVLGIVEKRKINGAFYSYVWKALGKMETRMSIACVAVVQVESIMKDLKAKGAGDPS